MASRTFRLETAVSAPPEQAIDYLARLDAHRGIHPYLESAVPVARGSDGEGDWIDWRIVERPTIGPFHYRIRFGARMIRISATTMIGHVQAAPGCTLETRTTATSSGGGSLVTETTLVTAPAPLVRYMTRHAEIAHARTFAALPHLLADAPPGNTLTP
ncbi:SRPBCC family protein [Microbacterium sp. 4R-513]|uniref:SRPBCC family protein n=1 Tax=Microbacterium sp. 4R-513 TaxID=2567934 RepID=UPI0013E13CDE|nr:SRPBCC family protein [Microbacterium sp. 4R-513]QIG39891.1 SRPBCC family protein [Microbacterium sp. 4R-513]